MRRPRSGLAGGLSPLSVRISDACRMTGIGRSKLYELIKDGAVEVIKVGAITLVPMSSIQALLDRGHQGETTSKPSSLAEAIHPVLTSALLTSSLSSTPSEIRRDLCSADERTRASAEDRIIERMVAALYEAHSDNR